MHNREDLGKLILRLALGGVVLFHGVFKLTHGVDWIKQPLAAHGLPGFLAYGAYLAEVLAPVLIVVGWKARLAALAIGFDMLMALYLVLRPQILAVKPQGGGWGIELEALLLFAALVIFLIGSGRYRLGRGAWD
jgi:putative oxidoreductase